MSVDTWKSDYGIRALRAIAPVEFTRPDDWSGLQNVIIQCDIREDGYLDGIEMYTREPNAEDPEYKPGRTIDDWLVADNTLAIVRDAARQWLAVRRIPVPITEEHAYDLALITLILKTDLAETHQSQK